MKRIDVGEAIAGFVLYGLSAWVVLNMASDFWDYLSAGAVDLASYVPTYAYSQEADLAAQQSMTRAAWAVFYSSIFQAVIGGAGLFALITTLRHSSKANEISERTAQIQLAPYLRCNLRHQWLFDALGKPVSITVTPSWTNVGQTLALDVAIHTKLQAVTLEKFGSELEFGVRTLEGATRSNIGPGGVMDGTVLFASIDEVLRLINDEIRGVIYSSAWFTDSFGAKHFVSVCFAPFIAGIPASRDDTTQGGVVFHTYPSGNWYQVDRPKKRVLPNPYA